MALNHARSPAATYAREGGVPGRIEAPLPPELFRTRGSLYTTVPRLLWLFLLAPVLGLAGCAGLRRGNIRSAV